MTHDELKVLIEEKFNNQSPLHDAQIVNALYRVVELHKPFTGREDGLIICNVACNDEGGYFEIYPCSTIEAIEKELA